MKLSPSVRGIRRFTSTTMLRAQRAAGLVTPTSMPNEQKPCSSGGLTWISAQSRGMTPRRNSRGISCRCTGM